MRRWIFVLFLLIVGLSLAQCEFDSIAAGGGAPSGHSIGLKSDGTVWCWGNNAGGQLGDGTNFNRYLPSQVVGPDSLGYLENIVAIAAGAHHSVALRADGTVWTWGNNRTGQLGDGAVTPGWATPNPIPRQVLGEGGVGFLNDVIAISAGGTHSAVLKSDGTVWAWGSNMFGQLGNGTSTDWSTPNPTPTQVIGPDSIGYLSDIVSISCGAFHTVALKSDSTVWTWGNNWAGQLGLGTTPDYTTPTTFPHQVVGPDSIGQMNNIVQIAAADTHTALLKSDGTVWTFGYNHGGQLGNGTDENSNTPVQVVGLDGIGFLTDVAKIACGGGHNLALKSDSSLWTWGLNTYGQLGDGSVDGWPVFPNPTPRQVLGLDGIGFLDDITIIAGGVEHSVVLQSDGTVLAFGSNYTGQLGDGTNIQSSIPVRVLCEDVEIAFSRGWNLVSVPTVEPQHSSVFGMMIYGYDPYLYEYFTADSLHPGKGYFVLSMAADMVELPRTLHSYSDTLFRGWNLIGAVNIPIPLSSIETDPPGLFVPSLFGWDGADYFPADTLYPGRGYWFLSLENGRIEVGL